MLLIIVSWAGFIFAVVLVRTGSSGRESAALVASVAQIAILLTWSVVYFTALRGDKAGLFQGGEGATAAVCVLLFLILLAGLTLPLTPEVLR